MSPKRRDKRPAIQEPLPLVHPAWMQMWEQVLEWWEQLDVIDGAWKWGMNPENFRCSKCRRYDDTLGGESPDDPDAQFCVKCDPPKGTVKSKEGLA